LQAAIGRSCWCLTGLFSIYGDEGIAVARMQQRHSVTADALLDFTSGGLDLPGFVVIASTTWCF
jgi:hypothetical protein